MIDKFFFLKYFYDPPLQTTSESTIFYSIGWGSEFDLFSPKPNHSSAPNINKKKKPNFQFTVNAETKKEASKI